MASKNSNAQGAANQTATNPTSYPSSTGSAAAPAVTRWLQQDITEEPFYGVHFVRQPNYQHSATHGGQCPNVHQGQQTPAHGHSHNSRQGQQSMTGREHSNAHRGQQLPVNGQYPNTRQGQQSSDGKIWSYVAADGSTGQR